MGNITGDLQSMINNAEYYHFFGNITESNITFQSNITDNNFSGLILKELADKFTVIVSYSD